MSLIDVVELYRKSNRPILTDDSFIAVLPASRETILLIKKIADDNDRYTIEDITDIHGSNIDVDKLVESELIINN